MKINFLGTSAGNGIPAPFCECEVCKSAIISKSMRSRCCICIDDHVLIDYPNEIRYFIIEHGLDLTKINSVFFTHSHGDHLNPMDLSLGFRITTRLSAENPLNIYANKMVFKKLDSWISDKNEYNRHKLRPFETYKVCDLDITPLPAKHDESEECFVFLISKGDKHLLYCTDSDILPNESRDFLCGYRLAFIALDCTWGVNEVINKGHMGLLQADEMRRYMLLNKISDNNTKWGLTHFSHRSFTPDFIKSAQEQGFLILNDGDEYNI